MKRLPVTRRELISSAVAAGTVAAVPPAWGRGLLSRRPRVGPGVFLDGVASGEPDPRGVTFWSRLDTDRPRSGARLVVARDRGMRRVVATAVVPTGRGVDGVLKARVGGLRPATEYFYAWESGTDVSPVGRTRTAPPADAPEGLRMAFSSCQHLAHGHYAAHAHAARLADLDLYLFLGDYVYERQRVDVRTDPIDAVDLGSYRAKYRLYRSDPALRLLHQLHPTAHVWDDHEVFNNYTGDELAPAAQRSAAYRAAFEWLPRMVFPRERHRIYKRLEFGAMADVFLLDERQYRSGQGTTGTRQMLGEGQMSWLISELKSSRARWKIVAQQVLVASLARPKPGNDSWDGFPADRARLLGEIERAGIQDVVFITGDAHLFMANLLASEFTGDLSLNGPRRPAAVEYVGGSLTSPVSETQTGPPENAPWITHFDSARHGYAHLQLAQDSLVTDFVAADVTSPTGAVAPYARFVQSPGVGRPVPTAPAPLRTRR